MIRSAAFLLALMLALPAAAQIYSWKDKDGRIHYADVPPSSGEIKTLRGAPPPRHVPAADESADQSDATAEKTETPADPEAAFRQRRAAEAEAAAKAAAAQARDAERQRFCVQARGQLAALKSGQRVARMREDGEREFLDDGARATEIDRLQQQIEQNCN
ncbi:MAG TPA: DUF4124 domain-containing protein [Thauera sp.]|nr:DUF4124 domain-containing protein [Thauera sp.]HRA81549.1 DUF4124 domain-containing protein [Thauera sp.]